MSGRVPRRAAGPPPGYAPRGVYVEEEPDYYGQPPGYYYDGPYYRPYYRPYWGWRRHW